MPTASTSQHVRDIADFRLFTIVCEFRFQNAYYLWDRAGTIWSNFVASHPSAKLVKADPAQTYFRLGSDYEFYITLDRLTVNAHSPSSIDSFATEVDEFVKLVATQLKIVTFTRVGVRPVFVREFPDSAAATAEMLGFRLVRLPDTPCFGIVGSLTEPRYTLRLEDKSKGCLVQISVNKRNFEAELPFAWEGGALTPFEKFDLLVDIDYYTLASASIGQLNVQEWIKQGMHVIRRDVGGFFGEVA